MRFPGRRVMLPDPALAEPQLVGPAQGLEVPSMTIEEAALRRMRRHRKQAVLHQDLRAAGSAKIVYPGSASNCAFGGTADPRDRCGLRLIYVNFHPRVSNCDRNRPQSAFFL